MSAARQRDRTAQEVVEATWAFGRGGGYPVYVEGAHAHTFEGRRAHVYAADGGVTHGTLLKGIRISKNVYHYRFRWDPAGPSRAEREAHRKARKFDPPTEIEPFIPWREYLARCKERNRGFALNQFPELEAAGMSPALAVRRRTARQGPKFVPGRPFPASGSISPARSSATAGGFGSHAHVGTARGG